MSYRAIHRKVLNMTAFGIIAFLVIVSALSCNLPPAGSTATLKIDLASNTNAKTLQPGISLDVVTYDIFGTGPSEVTFEALGIGSTIYLKEGLLPGDWSVYAIGKNAAGTAIAQSATSTVTLALAETKTVGLTCLPYAGNGSLRIDLSWPSESVVTPVIEASLTPEGGTSTPITFTITGSTASYLSGTTLTNGYYTLSLKLKDSSMSNYLVWSKVESVLIFKDQPTTANWVLTVDDADAAPAPGMTLTLTSDTKKPISIALAGYFADLQQGSTMTVSATGTPSPTSWQWYLDGDILTGQTTSSVTVGDGLVAGSAHTLSVIAKTTELAGSADVRFRITTSETKGVTTFADISFFSRSIVADSLGNFYMSSDNYHNIYKITSSAVIGILAGSSTQGSINGSGTGASFNSPKGIAIDLSGNVYVADTGNHKIRKITASGVVTTLAGSGVQGSMDGIGAAASFNEPWGVAVDLSGNVYVADTYNGMIRKITPGGEVSTIIGNASGVSFPQFITCDILGNLYITEQNKHKISKITPSGTITVFSGSGMLGSADGSSSTASYNNPGGMAFDSVGNLYVADTGNNKIRKITTDGVVTTLAGSGVQGSMDGTGTVASFYEPCSVAVDASGNVYVADAGNGKIRKIVQ